MKFSDQKLDAVTEHQIELRGWLSEVGVGMGSNQTTTPTVKHGGGNNLMVWGCMGWNGVGKLIEVQGKLDAEKYCKILEEGVEGSFETLEMAEDGCYF